MMTGKLRAWRKSWGSTNERRKIHYLCLSRTMDWIVSFNTLLTIIGSFCKLDHSLFKRTKGLNYQVVLFLWKT